MASMQHFTVRHDQHPMTRWMEGLRDLGNQTLRLINPVITTFMAGFGVSVICASQKFRYIDPWLQAPIIFALTLYVAFTAVITFGTWSSDRVFYTARRPNGVIKAFISIVSVAFLLWIYGVTIFAGDYAFTLGVGTLTVQVHYLIRIQGYNIRSSNFIIALLILAGMTLIHEGMKIWLTRYVALMALATATLIYVCR
ncbi:unnamed protein product [Microthlaspi erraticum]|uniref:Uncharacterized protein n=1 Tax=Microthlaspi erraticum TaxID=1685480 RepID=A0A6D2IUQ6_9BRAS|nr:unnamed protein product [Microthlaspi erraticum]